MVKTVPKENTHSEDRGVCGERRSEACSIVPVNEQTKTVKKNMRKIRKLW